ncbi:MAG: GntP family permease [Candidatus Cryptobacteroides sp.]
MNSAIAALIGLTLSIVLIIKKVSPVYSLMIGALAGGLLSGYGLEATIGYMFSGVKDIVPAVLRILAAGVLSGVLIKTGAAASISRTIVRKAGERHIYLALALSAMILTGAGVFVDVAVITVAPVALMLGKQVCAPAPKLLLAMIGGAKCGNVMSPNPNTIISAENFGAPLSSVMAAGIVPAVIGLLLTVYVLVPLMPSRNKSGVGYSGLPEDGTGEGLPSFWASLSGPLAAIVLLALRPLFGLVIDPMIALPVGGLVGIICTGSWKKTSESISFGLEKMSSVAVLLIGTGTIAGIIKVSAIKDVLIGLLSGWSAGGLVMAPLSGALMSAATASTTAGATIASASFAQTVIASGISAVWGAAMTNAGATVLDHLPHGSFFHATGGSVGMTIKERLKLVPYESAVGLVLALSVTLCCLIVS